MTAPSRQRTVLLTGAGGPAISGMIRVLRSWGYRIIAVDMMPCASGFFLADRSYIVPAGGSPEFLPFLTDICKKENVDAVVSVVDEELSKVSELEQLGIQVLQPQLSFVELCLDKLKCMRTMREKGINAPLTWSVSSLPNDLSYPLFVKPRVGRGSRGCGKVSSRQELDSFVSSSNYDANDLIVQEFIDGDEYTVSAIAWRSGGIQSVVPKQIISKVGVTKLAVTRLNKKIDDLCNTIQDTFQANGPFNVQLIIDSNGNPRPFEINPRFSTSITLTHAAGVDELGGLLSQALYGIDSYHFSPSTEGVVLIRHTYDEFLQEELFHSLAPHA